MHPLTNSSHVSSPSPFMSSSENILVARAENKHGQAENKNHLFDILLKGVMILYCN